MPQEAQPPTAKALAGDLEAAIAKARGGDAGAARAGLEELVDKVLTQLPGSQDPALADLCEQCVRIAAELGAVEACGKAAESLLAHREQTQPPESLLLLRARLYMARAVAIRGDKEAAKDRLLSAVQSHCKAQTKPSADLVDARIALGSLAFELSDYESAREQFETGLEESASITLRNPMVLHILRMNLANALSRCGRSAEAAPLMRQAMEGFEAALPAQHPNVLLVKNNLGSLLFSLGDYQAARALFEEVLASYRGRVKDNSPEMLRARMNLANSMQSLGDLGAARPELESVVSTLESMLPADDMELQASRVNYGAVLLKLRELDLSRRQFERAVEVYQRKLAPDNLDAIRARQNLAAVLFELGDPATARTLLEAVLASCGSGAHSHAREVAMARTNLAAALQKLGDLAGARVQVEASLVEWERHSTGSDKCLARGLYALILNDLGDHESALNQQKKVLEELDAVSQPVSPMRLQSQINLALIMSELGQLQAAIDLAQRALADLEKLLPNGSLDIDRSCVSLAALLDNQGRHDEAAVLQRKAMEGFAKRLAPTDGDVQKVRLNHVATLVAGSVAKPDAGAGAFAAVRPQCNELVLAAVRDSEASFREAALCGSVRETEERLAESLPSILTHALALAHGYGIGPRDERMLEVAFGLSESNRASAMAVAALLRSTEGSVEVAQSRNRLRAASYDLASSTQRGVDPAEYHAARQRREDAERALLKQSIEAAGGKLVGLDVTVEQVSDAIRPEDAIVAFRVFNKWWLDAVAGGESTPQQGFVPTVLHMGAFVLTRGEPAGRPRLSFHDLGTKKELGAAVGAWRAAVGASLSKSGPADGVVADQRGRPLRDAAGGPANKEANALRALLFDPIRESIAGKSRLHILLDGELHLLPIDALPFDEKGELLGDAKEVEVHVALADLIRGATPARTGGLVAFGGVDFDQVASPASQSDMTAEASPTASSGPNHWPEFVRLEHTGPEVRGVRDLYLAAGFEVPSARIAEGRDATRETLLQSASGARYLHLATHGWFAPDSIRSWGDMAEPVARIGAGMESPMQTVVLGMNPMLLCGLALAGANLPPDALGRSVGRITADEISCLDLRACELAVLSACETAAGERRVGQGVMSLQKALHLAGVGSTITSLWQAPDEASRVLMIEFYRRLWTEKKSVRQSLWEAKRLLREAKNASGALRYQVRDWAGWVLTGRG